MRTLVWSHVESDPAPTARDALKAAKAGIWLGLDEATRLRYLRMLVVLSLQAGTMTSMPPRPQGPEGRIEYGIYHKRMYRDAVSLEIASTVLRTLQLIVPPGKYQVQDILTEDGGETFFRGTPQEIDTGAFPLAVWIVGAVACTIASVLIAKVAGDVVDRQLARSEDTRKLISSQASAVELVLKHVQREEQERRSIPWEEAELMVLESLLKTQRRIAEKRDAPLPTPFAGAAKSLDTAVEKVGSGLGVAVPLAVAGGILFILWSKK